MTFKLPAAGEVIAERYRVVSRLGGGGMGLVFLAEQLRDGRRVALKFLDMSQLDESSIARFIREAKVALEVQHPGATQILDLGRDEAQRIFMAWELVEGEDLRDVLEREARVSLREARSITLQVADVLAFAHERGIVHRDVKPENLRIRRDGDQTHVKVLDFGIARLLGKDEARLTAEGTVAGTPRYMAPEQVADEALDGRVDQYALGLVFFELLAGTPATSGASLSEVLMNQLHAPVPKLWMIDAALANEAVDTFLARACAKSPGARFASMKDFIAALEALPMSAPESSALTVREASLADSTRPEGRRAAPDPKTEPFRPAVARPPPATETPARLAEARAGPRPVPSTEDSERPTASAASPTVDSLDRAGDTRSSERLGAKRAPRAGEPARTWPWVIGAVLLVVLGALGAWVASR